MTTAELSNSPWPGPRPYEEREWKIFFGRGAEVDKVMKRFSLNRLTLLSGPSGTGKTSLLRAGIVPRLRLRRYRDHATSVWPVLVVREWAASNRSGFTEMLKAEVMRSLDALVDWQGHGDQPSENRVASDRDAITRAVNLVGTNDPPLDIMEKIVDQEGIGGLYLVLDQFEEVLRFGKSSAKEMLRFIKHLYESGLPVKILISLRQEHLVDLRELERTVGGLMGQTEFLTSMDSATAKEAMEAAARERGVELGDYVVGEMIKLMGLEGDERFHLLALQAVLYDFFAWVTAEGGGVTRERLDEYRDDLVKQGLEGREAADYALKRWIERAITDRAEAGQNPFGLPPEQANALVRRIAIRLAPNLSSGGFKVTQEDSDLLRKGIGEDLRGLLSNPEQLRVVEPQSRKPPRLNTVDLALDGRADTAREKVSGLAYEKRWSSAATANMLYGAYLETMSRLSRGNVIKSIVGGALGEEEIERWELVHDGLGEPFAEWANEREDDWLDCSAALVACRGITPILVRPQDSERTKRQRVHHLRWEGCLIMPSSRSGAPQTFDHVLFESCALRGTVFQGITFLGCRFVDCELHGAIFKGCRFVADEEPCSFESCEPESLALIASRIYGLRFIRCTLSQLTLRDLEIQAEPLRFIGSNVSLSNFVGLTSRLPKGPAVLFDAECILRFCAGDDESWELLDFSQSEQERNKERKGQSTTAAAGLSRQRSTV